MSEVSTYNGGGGFGAQMPAVRKEREVATAIAETQGRLVIAQQFPRRIKESREMVLESCQRPRLAETAMYEYVRGGTKITGPSIRLAEELARCWGNIDYGLRELENRPRTADNPVGESLMQAYCHDLQTNVIRQMTWTVKHIRDKRDGFDVLTSERDIYEMIANQGARRLRACILNVIPGDIVEEAVEAIEKTLAISLDFNEANRVEKIKKLVANFKKFGVSEAQIVDKIQKNLDAMSPGNYSELLRIGNALGQGLGKVADYFHDVTAEDVDTDTGEIKSRSDSVKDRVKSQDEPQRTAEDFGDGVPEGQPGEHASDADDYMSRYRDYTAKIGDASSVEELDAVKAEIVADSVLTAEDQAILINGIEGNTKRMS